MDENISHAVALMGATLLFMVAFSLSVIFYDGLGSRAEEFFEATSTGARQEDATMLQADRTNIDRKITFQEVYMSILNLPAYVSGDGNASDSKIQIKLGKTIRGTYTASFDIENNIRKVTLSDAGLLNKSYLVGKKDSLNPAHNGLDNMQCMINDFCTLVLPSGATLNSPSNTLLHNNKDFIKDLTFSITYSSDAIVYTLN